MGGNGCSAGSRRFLLQRSGVAKIDPIGEGVVTFTRWTHGWTSVHLLPCVPSLGSMPRFSGFSSCGASDAHFLCPVQFASVAVHSTRVAMSLSWGFGSQRVLLGEAGARVSLNVT